MARLVDEAPSKWLGCMACNEPLARQRMKERYMCFQIVSIGREMRFAQGVKEDL